MNDDPLKLKILRLGSGMRLREPGGCQTAFLQVQNAVAPARESQIVSDQDRGEPVGLVKAGQELEDHLPGPEIEISSWLVGQQDRWLSHQRTGQNDTLLFPPDNSPARCHARAPSPTSSNLARDSEAARSCAQPRISNGIMTFSSAENSGSR